MPFACIFVPDFPVEAIVRAEPELRMSPVGVIEGKPPLQKICSVNEAARGAGISLGMTKLQAELCDEVVLRERSGLQEATAHAALLDCAQSFSPRVEDAGADTVLFDLSGLEKLFGTVPKIARQISRRASSHTDWRLSTPKRSAATSSATSASTSSTATRSEFM